MKQILFFALFGLALNASSYPDFQYRYLNAHEVIRKLHRFFPKMSAKAYFCSVDTESSLDLGLINPVDGEFLNAVPNSAFVKWYENCLRSILSTRDPELATLGIPDSPEDILKRFPEYKHWYGPLADAFKTAVETNSELNVSQAEFSGLAENIVEKILGPDQVIKEYGYLQGRKQIAEAITRRWAFYFPRVNWRTFDAMVRDTIMFVFMREEFISY